MRGFLKFTFTVIFFFGLLTGIVYLGIKNQRGLFYYLAQQVGFAPEFDFVSGTGSMYPTFPKGTAKTDLERSKEIVGGHNTKRYPGGIVLFGKRYFGYELQRGDIVFFANSKTQDIIAKETSSSADLNTGFVKRVIALSGDKIEIRDGFVKINDQHLPEPYIAKTKSTYGGSFLPDCKPLVIPDFYVFVMGDNRKGSNDSRFDLGFVAKDDIRTVISVDEQGDLKKNWRDISGDSKEANKPIFLVNEYLLKINEKRKEAKIPVLKYVKKLEQSAQKRADIIIKYNDTSFEATKSGYTMKKAMDEAGYGNVVWGEVPALGYYEADELLDNYFQFPDSKKFLLNEQFQETGIAASVGEINGCPIQVVVQHLAGYIPPNYPKSSIENWRKLIDNLNEAYGSWEKAKNFSSINQEELTKLLNLISQRRNNAQAVYDRMQKNLWLTREQEQMVNSDNSLHEEIVAIVNKLNQ